MIRTYLTLSAAALVLLLGYANCGEFKVSDTVVKNLTSSCVAKVRALASFSASGCDEITSYRCERQVFAPGASSVESSKVECVDSSCVVVATRGFDTSAAREGAAPGAFDVGGEYNREEVQCSNIHLVSNGISLVASDAASLAEALPAAIKQCHAKGSSK